MTAEQWLADLEDKAMAATPGPWKIGACLDMGTVRQRDGSILADCRLTTDDGIHNAAFISSANPATVLRLVAMLRILGNQLETLQQSPRMNCYFGSVLEKAYVATEKLHG